MSEFACDLSRAQRVMQGEGTVRPLRRMRLPDSGDVIDPSTSRLSPDHPLVRSEPHSFEPCWQGDARTVTRLRYMQRAAGRERSSLGRDRADTYGANTGEGFKLPSLSDQPLRLPS
jgi:hypothetical protein